MEDLKTWKIENGILTSYSKHGKNIPGVEELYSAFFEDQFCAAVTQRDVSELLEQLVPSKYPAEQILVLEPGNNRPVRLTLYATDHHGVRTEVAPDGAVPHVVINNVWYPLLDDESNGIKQFLKSAGIDLAMGLSLKQYFTLISEQPDFLRNEVEPARLQLPIKEGRINPSGIKATLYPYQVDGWQWLKMMADEGIGGVLADEMGLGKTLQIISLIGAKEAADRLPCLIVAPTTLLENWRRELAKFSPHIRSHIHQGSNRTGFPKELQQHDVVITSYDTVVRDTSLFNLVKWMTVVCDEAQAIKTPSTRRTQTIKKLPRKVGFAVTGTPIENRLSDLWSILDFAVPGFLSDLETFENLYGSTGDGAARLEKLISPLILRRLVDEVAKDLPAKIIIPQYIEFGEDEAESYEQIREDTAREFETNASLVVLIRLRMFCAHPFLLSNQPPGTDPAQYSNKYARMLEIVDEIVTNAAKVLIFTSFNKMNDMITEDLAKRFGIFTGSIDGRTETADRQKIVDKFSAVHGAAVLVLNPQAAGTGLNITAANHVIHYNLEWNPAKEDQASARAYRRGQDRPVTVHRLIYAGTVDEAIDERLTRKRNLAGTAIVGTKGDENDYADILSAISRSPRITQ